MTRKKLTVSAGLISALLLTASGCGTTPPKRNAYPGSDLVTSVNKNALVGTWQATILNPLEFETDISTVITLNADSTFLSKTDVPPKYDGDPGVSMESSGRWQVADGTLMYSDVKIEKSEIKKPDDVGDDPQSQALWEQATGGLMQFAANATTSYLNNQNAEDNAVNIFELSQQRIVLVGVNPQGSNPVAMEYTRIQ